jgi:23S rRNA (adenine2503-C2)-methyltransferase
MLSGSVFGTDQEEEEPDRLTVDRVERDAGGRTAAHHAEFPDRRGFGVGNRDAVADAGGEDLLPLLHRPQDLIGVAAGPFGQQLNQLAQNGRFVTGLQGHPDAVRRQQIAEQQIRIGHRSAPKLICFDMARFTGSPDSTNADCILDRAPDQAWSALEQWTRDQGLPAYRARQLGPRLWQRPVTGWGSAAELPVPLREALDTALPLPRLRLEAEQVSSDGTRKYLWTLADGEAIESVLIPSGSRRTLCISSQAGCALGCVFCATGRMGFRRNLTPFEIAGQVRELVLKDPELRPTNVVFMGMGEPLLNWPAVNVALSILHQPQGFGIGARHITVSTVGIVPGLLELAARPEQFRLAISLHAASGELRGGLMPIERKYGLGEVLEAASRFRKRITFEYVLIADRNDSDREADLLARLARKTGALVNLLPLHPGGAPGLRPASASRLRAFADRLRNQGIEAVVRRSRGLDISAACGQLAGERAVKE